MSIQIPDQPDKETESIAAEASVQVDVFVVEGSNVCTRCIVCRRTPQANVATQVNETTNVATTTAPKDRKTTLVVQAQVVPNGSKITGTPPIPGSH